MSETTNSNWANATPAGLVALAVACMCFFSNMAGLVDGGAALFGGVWLLGGFVVQIVVALVDLKSGSMSGGNVFLYFSAFFMLVSGLNMILGYFAPLLANLTGIPLDGRVTGWVWIALTLVTWLWTPAFFKSPFQLTLVVFFLDIALPFITLLDLGLIPHSLAIIPAVSLLLAGLTAIYLSAAMILNNAFGKSVLPITKPICK